MYAGPRDGSLAQLAEAPASEAGCCRFESCVDHVKELLVTGYLLLVGPFRPSAGYE